MSVTADASRRCTEKPVRPSRPIVDTQQQTIAQRVAVDGLGYWSGKEVTVDFRPAAPDTGIVFVRHDLPSSVRIPALVEHRIETPRRTTLSYGGATVEMVEHIMAALAGLKIDNCEVWTNASEMPGCDGSSQPFVAALDRAGTVAQNIHRSQLIVRETVRVGDADHWVEARPSNDGSTTLRYRLDYSDLSQAIGRQTAEFTLTPEVFRKDLAPCRTFMLEEEAKWLLAQGFGTHVKPSDILVFDDDGPIGNELLFENECVRHKLLDLVGDLALGGCDVVGHIIAHRSGHRLNGELIQALLTEGHVTQNRRLSA